MNIQTVTMADLWSPVQRKQRFTPELVQSYPEPIRRYLGHAIAPGTPLARAVHIDMEGEVRLGDRWLPFTAEQVIHWDRGLIWQARARLLPGVEISGSDRLIDGEGAMRWQLMGIVPVMTADGPDISRSASGRLEIESMWLPSVLLDPAVGWRVIDHENIAATVAVPGGFTGEVQLEIDGDGRVRSSVVRRWGNPENRRFRYEDFGGTFDREDTFGGYTVPSSGRVGWYFGTPRFDTTGEFFRFRVVDMVFA